VFVFDDFEDGNLEVDSRVGYRLKVEALEVLRAFGTAIARTGSPSRVVVTSRYDFDLPAEVEAVRLPISQLQGNDLDKKLLSTQNLGPRSTIDPLLRERAVAATAGVPSLIESMDALVGTLGPDIEAGLRAVEAQGVQFRDGLLLGTLVDAQTGPVRQVIALTSVFEIAVPIEAILVLSPDRPIHDEVDIAVRFGLLQAGLHPTTGELRYLVSSLVRSLIEQLPERLDSASLREAQGRAARFLYRLWVNPDAE
jgi:hypothetical protein